MTKLKFDYQTIKSGVIPQLESTISSLNSASSIFSSMDIPNFGQAGSINEASDTVSQSISQINHIIDWLEESNKVLDDVIDSYVTQSKMLPKELLNKRDSVIRIK